MLHRRLRDARSPFPNGLRRDAALTRDAGGGQRGREKGGFKLLRSVARHVFRVSMPKWWLATIIYSLAVVIINPQDVHMAYEEKEPDPERIKLAIAELERVRREQGSLNKAAMFILENTGVSVTSEGLRRALARGVVGKSLADAGEKLATLPRSPMPTNAKTGMTPIDTTDPYPNRAPAIAMLRGIVDPQTLDALRSVSNKGGDLSFDDWIQEAKRIQRLRESLRREFAEPQASPASPAATAAGAVAVKALPVSDEELAARAAQREEEKKRRARELRAKKKKA